MSRFGRFRSIASRYGRVIAPRAAHAARIGAGYAIYRGREKAEAKIDAERERKLLVEIARKKRKNRLLRLQIQSAQMSKRLRA